MTTHADQTLDPVPPLDADQTPASRAAFEHQALLDDLYWNSDRSIRSIGEQFGLTAAEVTARVTPFSAGVRCWWCGEEVTFRKRSERTEAGRRYGRIRCACTALQPHVSEDPRLVGTAAAILVPVGPSLAKGAQDLYGASTVLDDGIDALASCGLRWTGCWRPVEVGTAPADVLASLADLPERFVVVPALRHLATNDGDALALFIRLVLDGWRVITSARRRYSVSRREADCWDEFLGSPDGDRW